MAILNIGAQPTKQSMDQLFIAAVRSMDMLNTTLINTAKWFAQNTTDDIVAVLGVEPDVAAEYQRIAAMFGQIPQVVAEQLPDLDAALVSIRQLA
jgi:hypothetical protein